MAVVLELQLVLKVDETIAQDLGTGGITHTFPSVSMPLSYADGSAANTQDVVWSDTRSAAASADTINLDATLTRAIGGAAITFATVSGFAIYNKSTTTAEVLKIGAGSNPFINWVSATGDAIDLGPGGIFMWTSPVDGAAVTTSTGDILTIDPGSDTIAYDIIIWGVST
jgi:hypothetical protein